VVLSTAVGRSSFRGKPDIVYATLPTQSYEPMAPSTTKSAQKFQAITLLKIVLALIQKIFLYLMKMEIELNLS